MKQLVILSGKGGTGKTSITAAFAHLCHSRGAQRAVLADADVDAANLELVLKPQVLEEQEFIGGAVAVINTDECAGCGTCAQVCRFDAIFPDEATGTYRVDDIACEGCAACRYQCPSQAIEMQSQVAGRWFHSQSRYGPMFHAALRPAQENSGKLVTLVKQQARLLAMDAGYELVLVDGPPGIGCPVISASAGADLALLVAEPSRSGQHDLERIVQTTRHFGIPTLVCINKADVYPEGAEAIHRFCQEQGIEVVGNIPFDEGITQAMIVGEPITAWNAELPASRAIAAVWQRVLERSRGNDEHNGTSP